MNKLLKSLRRDSDHYLVELTEGGFDIVRRSDSDAQPFNTMVREIVSRSGEDYVALPRADGRTGYDRIFIIPLT